MHPFKISDKIVCVNSSNIVRKCDLLVLGKIYVVRELTHKTKYIINDGVKLVGMHAGYYDNPNAPNYEEESGYMACRFRKLSDIQEENRLNQYNMSPAELTSLGITSKAQRTFLASTLDAMKKGCK